MALSRGRAPSSSAPQPESRVLVLATGGTIMMVPGEDGLAPVCALSFTRVKES